MFRTKHIQQMKEALQVVVQAHIRLQKEHMELQEKHMAEQRENIRLHATLGEVYDALREGRPLEDIVHILVTDE